MFGFRLSSLSLVEFNSSVLLGLTMYLFKDESYSRAYSDPVELGHEDTLYFQVALQTNHSFASDVLLQVESCWATESTDPQDAVQAVFLEDGYVFFLLLFLFGNVKMISIKTNFDLAKTPPYPSACVETGGVLLSH